MLILPVAMGILLTIAVGGLLIAGWVGRPLEGERMAVTLEAGCAEALLPVVQGRVASVGLGEPEFSREGDRIAVTATFPGLSEGEEQDIPRLLTRPGTMGVYAAGEGDAPEGEPLATEADIEEVFLQLDLRGHPYVEVKLQPRARDRVHEAATKMRLVYVLEGEVVSYYDERRGLKGQTIDLQPAMDRLEDELRAATDWSILLKHGPAPCEASVVSVAPAG